RSCAGRFGRDRDRQLFPRSNWCFGCLRGYQGVGKRGLIVRADVSDRGQVVAMINQVDLAFASVDILVNNAGVTLSLQGRGPSGAQARSQACGSRSQAAPACPDWSE